MGGLHPLLLHSLQNFDPRQHAQGAVEVPAVVDGVDVGADQDYWSIPGHSLATAEQVPRGVLAHREPGFDHVRGDPVFGGSLFIRKRQPGYAASFVLPYLAEVGDPAPKPLAVYHVSRYLRVDLAVYQSPPRAQRARASSSAPKRRSGVRPYAVTPSRPVTVPAARSAFRIASSVASAAA